MTVLGSALLEGERLPGLVHGSGLRMVDELAQVEEMLLAGGFLAQLNVPPLGNELGEVHGFPPSRRGCRGCCAV